MGGWGLGWALRVVTPWCLGIGLLVSITADAGQDASIGASLALLTFRAATAPKVLIPDEPMEFGIATLPGKAGGFFLEPRLRHASLTLGDSEEFTRLPEEIEPRRALKRRAQNFPAIDRSRKGDPAVSLRPTFDTKLRAQGGLISLRAGDLLFQHDEASPSSGFAEWDNEPSDLDSVAHFEPWPDGESPTTANSTTDASPHQDSSAKTSTLTSLMRPASINERLLQGASPATPRAVALGSTTPAALDATPIEVVSLSAKPHAEVNPNILPQAPGRPNYASLVGSDQAGREKRCLAEAIYFEARSEPEEGQAAVAQVVLNRATSGLYPSTICGVVYQNRQHYNACQFSFACEGKSLKINEPDAWHTAVRIAEEVTEGKTYLADVGGATHYHANYVRPYWAKALKKMDVIGHHIFYKLRPGQT